MQASSDDGGRPNRPAGAATLDSVLDRIWHALRKAHGSLNLQTDCSLEPERQNIYLLINGGRSYHVKWISAGDNLGYNEVRVNRDVLCGSAAPAPRMVLAAEADGGLVAVWEKLDGTDLRAGNRNRLPDAFRLLGRFHVTQRCDGPVHSNATDKDYPGIREMLRDELELHCRTLPDGQAVGERCAPVLAALEDGFTTLVHGDFHPGNIIASSSGLHFIDWAYAHRGLNLLDLDYVESIELAQEGEQLPWWTVGPAESGPALAAYFDACGLVLQDVGAVHRAVMLLAQLRAHTNARRQGGDAEGAVALRDALRRLGV